MGKALDYNYAKEVIDMGQAKCHRQFKERNDCSVRAIATACGVTYDAAHNFMRDVMGRVERKGAEGMTSKLKGLKQEAQDIGTSKVIFRAVPDLLLKNKYKVKGQEILRKKTVKSFIDDFRKGTFLVFVANHVFTVKDGVLIDNVGEEFRPTRKVLDAVEVIAEDKEKQLEMF